MVTETCFQCLMNTDGSDKMSSNYNAAIDADPSWLPDGSRIAFESYHDGD